MTRLSRSPATPPAPPYNFEFLAPNLFKKIGSSIDRATVTVKSSITTKPTTIMRTRGISPISSYLVVLFNGGRATLQ